MLRKWHSATTFPTPGIKLLVKTKDGNEIPAIRNHYAKSYSHDPDYRDLNNNKLNEVTQWSIL